MVEEVWPSSVPHHYRFRFAMNKALLLFVALAAMGAAAFLALTTRGGGALDDAGVRSADVVQGVGADSGEMETMVGPDALAGPEARRTATATSSVSAEVAPVDLGEKEAVAQVERKATLTGRITNANGAPVPGATAIVQRRDLADLFDDDGVLHGGSGFDVESDAAGRFSIEARHGNVRLEIEADGFAPHSVPTTIAAGETKDIGDIRLETGVTLSGRVVDGFGDGISGAKLHRVQEAGARISIFGADLPAVATTGRGGEFEVLRQGVGAYRFTVSHPAHPSAKLAGTTEQPGEAVPGLKVVLEAGGTIRGVAIGIPQGSRNLSAVALPGEDDHFEFAVGAGMHPRRVAVVGADGSFELTGLKPGATYRVQLRVKAPSSDGPSRRSASVLAAASAPGAGHGPAAPVQVAYSLGATVSFTSLSEDHSSLLPDAVRAGFDYAGDWENVERDAETGRCVVAGLWPTADGQALLLTLTAKGYHDWKAENLMLYPGDRVELGEIQWKPRPSIRVTVLDEATGDPIEGAFVKVQAPQKATAGQSFTIRSGGIEDGDSDFDDALFAGLHGDVRAGRTDADGVCVLDATAGAEVVISAHSSRHTPGKAGPITLPETTSVYEYELRLAEGGSLRFIAQAPSGAAAADYSVKFRDGELDDAPGLPGRTGDDGILVVEGLAPGEHFVQLGSRKSGTVFVMPGPLGGKRAVDKDETWVSAVVLPGEVTDVALVAPAIGVLVGKVRELGAALSGVKVELRSTDDDPLSSMMMLGGGSTPSATSDARGEFKITGIEAGDYELVMDHANRAMAHIQTITIKGGEQEVDVDLTVTEITGRVTDEAGEPVAGARVEASRAPVPGETQRTTVRVMMMTTDDDGGGGGVMMDTGGPDSEPATTDSDGRYRLRGVESGVLLEVAANATGYDEAKTQPFTVGDGSEESDADIVLKTPGAIRVHVAGLAGPALVSLRRAGDGPPKMEFLNGEDILVDSLAPGTWTVTVRSTNGADLVLEPAELEVEVRAGETALAEFAIQ